MKYKKFCILCDKQLFLTDVDEHFKSQHNITDKEDIKSSIYYEEE